MILMKTACQGKSLLDESFLPFTVAADSSSQSDLGHAVDSMVCTSSGADISVCPQLLVEMQGLSLLIKEYSFRTGQILGFPKFCLRR